MGVRRTNDGRNTLFTIETCLTYVKAFPATSYPRLDDRRGVRSGSARGCAPDIQDRNEDQV